MVILKGLKCLEKGQHFAIAKTAIGAQNGGVLYWSPKWRDIGAQNGEVLGLQGD